MRENPALRTRAKGLRLPTEIHRRARAAATLLSALLMSACAGPEPTVVDTQPVQSRAQGQLPSLEQAQAMLEPSSYEANQAELWWQQFNDTALSALVERGQAAAFDVRFAAAQLDAARAAVRGARALGQPSVSLQGSQEISQTDIVDNGLSRNARRTESTLGLGLDWQLDLFNSIGASVSAAEARAGSAEALLRDVRRVLTVQIVSNYVQLRSVQRRLIIASESERRRVDNVDRIKRLVDRGYGTILDLQRTQSQLYQVRADRAGLANNEVQLINQLAILTDQPLNDLHAMLKQPDELWAPPPTAPLPHPTQILRQRPDLRALERNLAAAAFDVDASKAALYPSLTLGVDLFKSGITAGLLPSFPLLSGRILTSLAWPLLGRGRLLAQVDQTNARLDSALVTYERGVLNAMSEIDTALNALARTREIHDHRVQSAAAAREAEQLSRRLFLAGEVEYVSVVVAEQTRAAEEDAAVAAQRDALLAYVNYVGAVVPAW